jgi:hypothetical protein
MRAMMLGIFLVACHDPDPPKPVEICRNGVDDDNDKLTDCADDDCSFVCGENCTDGIDNDRDGKVDCADEGCDGQCAEVCDDGRDNDGDGMTDCLDPGDCGSVCPESCDDDVDNDNDGATDCLDSDCTSTCDNDSDGYFSVDLGGDDCDDANPNVHPGVQEVCDGYDDDCNGLTDGEDPNVYGADVYYNDDDADGYGNSLSEVVACQQPAYSSTIGGDCDDANGAIHPGAAEVCSGEDEDCDTLIDEADPDLDTTTLTDWYVDDDGDGYGASGPPVRQCLQPAGYADNPDDCDDGNKNVGPEQQWVFDTDHDGYGSGAPTAPQCYAPGGGWVALSLGVDCNDANTAIHPGANDICGDGIDQDCDGADFLGCYDTAAFLSRYGTASVDEIAGTYDGVESVSFVGTPSGWLVCEWTWTMLDWDHDPTAVGGNPFLTPCFDPDLNACDWSFTVHGSDGQQTGGTDCAFYGLTPTASLNFGPYGYGWTENYSAGGVSYGPSQMYYLLYTGYFGTPPFTWIGFNSTFSNADYDQLSGTYSYDWQNYAIFPTP